MAAMHTVMQGQRKVAANIAGGTHHAFAGHGEGFCKYVFSKLTLSFWNVSFLRSKTGTRLHKFDMKYCGHGVRGMCIFYRSSASK